MFKQRDSSANKILDQIIGNVDEVSLGRVTHQMYSEIYNNAKTDVENRVKYIDQDLTNMVMNNQDNNNTKTTEMHRIKQKERDKAAAKINLQLKDV